MTDRPSALWAYELGVQDQQARERRYGDIPFKFGTDHRKYWFQGFQGLKFQYPWYQGVRD